MTEISPQELKARLDRNDALVLLDVREGWETALCRLENATHIPIEEIEFRTAELDPADEIIVYCHHGVRSAAVANFLRQQGFRAVNLEGGLDLWAHAIDRTMKRY
ncbi:MAG TPA: rhodanese-like domain-containing protein [Candidatus Dormibacteraeota bacterium]|jgi:rhodanese-related sulfurtransferase|nr:rhodanese-like domain-containing protein [Candidatus Dormibacteraeota bacterium]